MKHEKQRAFTLLEVLVAVAILGLGLSVILSAQTGLFNNANRAENMSVAPELVRCKMNEIEVELLEDGFPIIDQKDSGRCCGDEANARFSCEWTVQLVKMPEPRESLFGSDAGLGDIAGESSLGGGLGSLGSLAQAQDLGAGVLGGSNDLGGVASMLSQSGGNPVDGVASIVMGMVYPELKPMFEASIRKVTVSVLWKEGKNQRDLTVVQYIASPQQGGFDGDAAAGLEGLEGVEGLSGLSGGGATPASPGGGRGMTPSSPASTGARPNFSRGTP